MTALWRNPRGYARFLGIELSLAYKGRLLVVMPNGFGFNWPGHPSGSAYRLLAGIPVRAGGDGFYGATSAAVIEYGARRRREADAGGELAERPGARARGPLAPVAPVAARRRSGQRRDGQHPWDHRAVADRDRGGRDWHPLGAWAQRLASPRAWRALGRPSLDPAGGGSRRWLAAIALIVLRPTTPARVAGRSASGQSRTGSGDADLRRRPGLHAV